MKKLLIIGLIIIFAALAYLFFLERREEVSLTETSPFVGTFVTNLPAASSPGRTITLVTTPDQQATFTQDFQNDEELMVSSGVWAASEVGDLIVTLNRRDAEALEEPKVMIFNYLAVNGGVLQLVDQEGEWGSTGLTLQNIEPLASSFWLWQETVISDDTRTETNAEKSFGLRFGEDGRVSVTTDCNNGMGPYQLSGESHLSFGPLATTLMYCEGSMESVFMGQLAQVDSYLLENGKLQLLLKLDSGTMTFEPAPLLAE